ncbi:hypothetical protein [Streptacidiphilus sp. PAMC 29251]
MASTPPSPRQSVNALEPALEQPIALEPAMAANGIGSFDWDLYRDIIVGDARACRILGIEDPAEHPELPRSTPSPSWRCCTPRTRR